MSSEENRASWCRVREDIAEYPQNEIWDGRRQAINPMLDQALELGMNSYFRAGMGMHQLIISTADHHGLRGEPGVTVEVTEDRKLRISYSTKNVYFNPPIQSEVADPASAFPVFLIYLRRLWADTSSQPLPDVLRPPIDLVRSDC